MARINSNKASSRTKPGRSGIIKYKKIVNALRKAREEGVARGDGATTLVLSKNIAKRAGIETREMSQIVRQINGIHRDGVSIVLTDDPISIERPYKGVDMMKVQTTSRKAMVGEA